MDERGETGNRERGRTGSEIKLIVMTKNEFLQLLQQEAASLQKAVSTPNGDWIVKKFKGI